MRRYNPPKQVPHRAFSPFLPLLGPRMSESELKRKGRCHIGAVDCGTRRQGLASQSNTDAIAALGGVPYISFATHHRGNGGGTWEKMYHYFQFKRDELLQHYHKRSNVESTFSMMKRQFGDSLRSKTDIAMTNETLCKVLCHNLVVPIHEMYELGIDPSCFGARWA